MISIKELENQLEQSNDAIERKALREQIIELVNKDKVTILGYTFNLNRPHKWTVKHLMEKVKTQGDVSITSCYKLTKESSLKDFIKTAHYLEDYANEHWRDCDTKL